MSDVIELLISIKNNVAPRMIIFKNESYWYDGICKDYYKYVETDLDGDDTEYLFENNDVISILEEKIIIPKTKNQIREAFDLPPIEDKKTAKIGKLNQVSDNKQHLNNYILRNKINEIIDRINLEDK